MRLDSLQWRGFNNTLFQTLRYLPKNSAITLTHKKTGSLNPTSREASIRQLPQPTLLLLS